MSKYSSITLPAPLYIQQGNKVKKPEWYHHAFTNFSLCENGMQRWFLIRLNYVSLLEPEKVVKKINQSPVSDKEGTAYVMKVRESASPRAKARGL